MVTPMRRSIWITLIGILLVPASARAQDEVVYFHTDAIGSVRVVTDATGAVIARYDYLPFGERWDPPQNPDSRRFAGKELDVETGLDYFGARYYLSPSGRFTTVDPLLDIDSALVNPQLWNRYAYALNNPLSFVDPTGAAIELLGGAEDREKELDLLRRSIGHLGSRLYINEVKSGNNTRYFVGIRGDVGDFARAGGTAQGLANLVVHENVVEFGLTNQNLARLGGAGTFEPGEAGDNQNTRVLVNPGQMGLINQRLSPNTILGVSRFEGEGASRINPFTVEVVAWHEFGHAWGFINGRTMRRTNAEALQWENQMRALVYGPLGRANARRIRH